MNNPDIAMFEQFAADLSYREAHVRANLPARSSEQVLGIGRSVVLLDFSVGVFVRGATHRPPTPSMPNAEVDVDFVFGNQVVSSARASYLGYGDRITVNHEPGDPEGQLSVVSLAKILYGVDLRRDIPDERTPAFEVSQKELDFVHQFTTHPDNRMATFHFIGQPFSGIEVTLLD